MAPTADQAAADVERGYEQTVALQPTSVNLTHRICGYFIQI